MNRSDGRRIDNLDHLRQSVQDILTTPLGSRVMRRRYGSLIPALMDQPIHAPTNARICAAAAAALMRWEPRLRLRRIRLLRDAQRAGHASLLLDVLIHPMPGGQPRPLSFEVQL